MTNIKEIIIKLLEDRIIEAVVNNNMQYAIELTKILIKLQEQK